MIHLDKHVARTISKTHDVIAFTLFSSVKTQSPVLLQEEVQYTVKVQLYSQSIAHGKSKVAQSQVCGLDGVTFTFYEYVLLMAMF